MNHADQGASLVILPLFRMPSKVYSFLRSCCSPQRPRRPRRFPGVSTLASAGFQPIGRDHGKDLCEAGIHESLTGRHAPLKPCLRFSLFGGLVAGDGW